MITCPPELAYGDKRSGIIPPNSTLRFEIEVIDCFRRQLPQRDVFSLKKKAKKYGLDFFDLFEVEHIILIMISTVTTSFHNASELLESIFDSHTIEEEINYRLGHIFGFE